MQPPPPQDFPNAQPQAPMPYNASPPQPPKPIFEELVANLVSFIDTRFQGVEASVRNQEASIHNLEHQIGQIAKLLSDKQLGILPANTKATQAKSVGSIDSLFFSLRLVNNVTFILVFLSCFSFGLFMLLLLEDILLLIFFC
jgi:hypothetical protein